MTDDLSEPSTITELSPSSRRPFVQRNGPLDSSEGKGTVSGWVSVATVSGEGRVRSTGGRGKGRGESSFDRNKQTES